MIGLGNYAKFTSLIRYRSVVLLPMEMNTIKSVLLFFKY
jgi:hypothetical protein